MAILNFWGKLWQSSGWNSAIEQVAELSADSVFPRIGQAALAMAPAERYGYIRAHATVAVQVYSAQAIAEQTIRGAHRQQQFAHEVMQRVIDLVGLRLSQQSLSQAIRRAA